MKPVKNQSAWRPVLARLQLLQELIPQFDVARGGAPEGFQLEPLMRFIGQAFTSANAEVGGHIAWGRTGLTLSQS